MTVALSLRGQARRELEGPRRSALVNVGIEALLSYQEHTLPDAPEGGIRTPGLLRLFQRLL